MAGSCIPAVKAYLFGTVLPSLFPQPVHVSYGDPGTYQPDDIVAVGDARAVADAPVMATTRPVEETVELDLVISCWRGGGPEAQQTATEAAFTMLATLRDHFKTRPNETLGGACRTARVTGYELFEEIRREGRLAEIVITMTIKARN